MLIRFTVENFLSFKDEVEFSMVAGRQRRHPDHILPRKSKRDLRVLKTAVIYGANASGKSNLIKAMSFAKNLIVQGTRPNQRIATSPFLFDTTTKDLPSKFNFDIRCNKQIYAYGFEVDRRNVQSEWLYEIRPRRSSKMIFERVTDSARQTHVTPGNVPYTPEQDEQFFEFVAKGTRPNQLFLTECIERNVTYFEEVSRWFNEKLVLVFPDTRPAGIEIAFMSDETFKSQFINLVKRFDLGIENIRLENFEFESETRIPAEVKDQIMQDIQEMSLDPESHAIIQIPALNILVLVDENQKIISKKFVTLHIVTGDDKHESLELTEESEGTQRIFEIIPALFELLNDERERVFVIDELDRRLHSMLSYKILELFLSKSKGTNNQLIVTTHEVGILDLDLLRRDEIWFIEKNNTGASSAYPLEEFHPRYDKDIRKSYLQGRYGAIPLLPSRRRLELEG